ncbi:MAG: hypothetical protein U0136_20740 [Bdellovibrionota bacterium]
MRNGATTVLIVGTVAALFISSGLATSEAELIRMLAAILGASVVLSMFITGLSARDSDQWGAAIDDRTRESRRRWNPIAHFRSIEQWAARQWSGQKWTNRSRLFRPKRGLRA